MKLNKDQFAAILLDRFCEAERRGLIDQEEAIDPTGKKVVHRDRNWAVVAFLGLIEMIARRLLVKIPDYYGVGQDQEKIEELFGRGHNWQWQVFVKGWAGDEKKGNLITFQDTYPPTDHKPASLLADSDFPLRANGEIGSSDPSKQTVEQKLSLFDLVYLRNNIIHGFTFAEKEHLQAARDISFQLVAYVLKKESFCSSKEVVNNILQSWRFLKSEAIRALREPPSTSSS